MKFVLIATNCVPCFFFQFYDFNLQFPLPHSRGSSHGQSRGIRKAYPEPYLTKMMNDAYEQWHELEKINHENIFK